MLLITVYVKPSIQINLNLYSGLTWTVPLKKYFFSSWPGRIWNTTEPNEGHCNCHTHTGGVA